MNIPARYTFGYLPDIGVVSPDTPIDFQARFQAYIGGCCHAFDPRHNRPRIGRVIIGYGRDAVDVALTCAYPTHHRPTNAHYVSVAVGRDYADVAPTSGTYTGSATGVLSATKYARIMGERVAAPRAAA